MRLIVEASAPKEEFQYITEANSPNTLYVKGPYMGANMVNRNKREYPLEEMQREIERYKTEMIKECRSLGELNHPTSADVNPERACHMIVEMWQDGNTFYGKSKITTSPMGLVVRSLINDGVKLGMSSRALGQLVEGADKSVVKDMRLIAVDCVHDPSYPKAFVNGILESKQWVLNSDGCFTECYDVFEKSIAKLPKHETDVYLKNKVLEFINAIKNKC